MKKFIYMTLSLFALSFLTSCNKDNGDVIDVAKYVDTTGKSDCSDKIQNLINNNPNRTLYFRDGIYLLKHQILTPGNPTKSVDLRLSNYAILRAADDYEWERAEIKEDWQDKYLYMVSLGGLDRDNDVLTPGSVYGLTGGIIDGNGIAAGVEIAGGRETRVQNVSMKGVEIGLRIAPGVNSGSSDADISDLSIICNDSVNSYGLKLEGSDNSATNIRIGHVTHGVYIASTGGTNILRNVHPLHNGDCLAKHYQESIGFEIKNFCELNNCYSDNFRVGYKLYNNSSFISNCVSWWFNPGGDSGEQYAIEKAEDNFNCSIDGLVMGVKKKDIITPTIMIGNENKNGTGTIKKVRVREIDKITDIELSGGKYMPKGDSILSKYFDDDNGINVY